MSVSTENNGSKLTMAEQPENITLGAHIEVRYGLYWFVLTVLFFQVVNRVMAAMGTPKSVPASDEWKWRNLVISWIHALICGTWDLSCLYFYPELLQDMVNYGNYYIYGMIAFTTGYFVYDSFDMYINNKHFKLWEVSLHHIAICGTFTFGILTRTCIAYHVIALLAEVNSFFLHSRKILQMLRVDYKHWFYKLTIYSNLGTFVVFRGLAEVMMIYGLYMDRSRVSSIYYLFVSSSVFIVSAINPVLFYRLVKSDIFRSKKPSGKDISKLNQANGVHYNAKQDKAH